MSRGTGSWVFLTNHAHVLLCIARDPDIRARDVAEHVGITERAAQRLLADLVSNGYVEKTKNGRRRWCDMATCGNRAKAARHRQKVMTHV